ncbi:MAG: hypothetical protein ACE5NG_09275, partial [bacterium]
MARKITLFVTSFLFLFVMLAFGTEKKVGPVKKVPFYRGDEIIESKNFDSKPQSSAQIGPGTVLMQASTYDFNTNNSVPRNIINFGDGTLAVGRMEETTTSPSDRSSYYVFNDGSNWLLPMTRIETTRHGWGNISAMADGREVISAHGGIEVNVDA